MISINSSTGPLLQLNGVILLILILVVGAWIGWSYGFRSFLSVTLASTVGYFLFVGGGNLILDYINNIYSNLPRIFALLTGGDPFAAGTLEPIAVPFTLPLALRVLFFVVFVMVGYYYNTKPAWYSNNLKNPADPHIQLLGGFTGALTALVWVSAANVFWQEYIAETGSTSPGLINGLVGILPDVRAFVPYFMLGLIVFLVVAIVLRIPVLFKQPAPPAKK